MLQTILPIDWGKVLERVELALKQAEAEAAEREKDLPAQAARPAKQTNQEADWHESLARIEKRSQNLRIGLEQIGKGVHEVDAELQANEDALKQWLAVRQSVGQDLAKWAERQVE